MKWLNMMLSDQFFQPVGDASVAAEVEEAEPTPKKRGKKAEETAEGRTKNATKTRRA